MALPVVLKSGKNYISLVLDKDMEFEALLAEIINKFIENASFFEGQSLALMFEGRDLNDREKNIILDAIEAYTVIHVKMLLENDEFKHYAVEKAAYDRLHPIVSDDDDEYEEIEKDERLKTLVENNCYLIDRDVLTGERIFASNNIIVEGNVESGSILKAGNSIIVNGKLEGQALAGNDDRAEAPYIIAKDFCPENFRIGTLIGHVKKKGGLRNRKPKPRIAQLIDGEIQILPYNN